MEKYAKPHLREVLHISMIKQADQISEQTQEDHRKHPKAWAQWTTQHAPKRVPSHCCDVHSTPVSMDRVLDSIPPKRSML